MKIAANGGSALDGEGSLSQISSGRTPLSNSRNRSLWKLPVFVLLNVFVFNFAILLLDRYVVHTNVSESQSNTFLSTVLFLKGFESTDSLGAMLPAIHLLEGDRKAPVYESIFFQQQTKFQYPLTSLLPYYAWQRLGASDGRLYHASKVVIYLCIGLTILFTILIAVRYIPTGLLHGPRRFEIAVAGVTIAFATLFFCPVMVSAVLGQVQTLLTLGFAVALYCWITGSEVAAGVIMGLMVLVKPQYGLFFLWALIRKKYSAAAAGLICAGAGVLLSCVVFGLHNNLEYFQVLRYISARGESYCANQSVNGLLNRLLFNGNNLTWDANHFAPYNTIVYLGTIVSSLGLLALALFYPWGKRRKGGAADFACIVLVATMASPIAWVHHYGITLPILVWLWFSDYGRGNARGGTWMIAAAYVLLSNSVPPLAAVASIPVLNIFESYLYLGAILVLILLLTWRIDDQRAISRTF
jgi:alpha-1,2-mannosyltransferase